MLNRFFWSKPRNVLGLLFITATLLGVIWGVPKLQVWGKDSLTQEDKNLRDVETAARGVVVNSLTAFLLLGTAVTGYFTYRSSQEKNQSERFEKYVGMLTNEKDFICIAGVYGLEELTKENSNYPNLVINVLEAFIRDSFPWPARALEKYVAEDLSELRTRVSLISDSSLEVMEKITELRLAPKTPEISPEELEIRGAALVKLMSTFMQKKEELEHIVRAYEELELRDSAGQLIKAFFSKTQTTITILVKVFNLKHRPNLLIPLTSESLSLNLSLSDLRGISVLGEDMRATVFMRSNLASARFSDSDLRDANFSYAVLAGTSFENAKLQNADFSFAEGLTVEQLQEAKSCRGAKVPKYVFDGRKTEEIAELGVICVNSNVTGASKNGGKKVALDSALLKIDELIGLLNKNQLPKEKDTLGLGGE